jgi:L-malate glycosyltransferase
MTPSILHIFPAFAAEGPARHTVRLWNALGGGWRHVVVSGDPAQTDAMPLVSRKVSARLVGDFPALSGSPTPGRLQKLARAMQGHDLVCTYGWGAIDGAMAHTLFRDLHGLPPLVHHESDAGAEEFSRPRMTRNWYRRIALGRTSALVVPDEAAREVAIREWQQPEARVHVVAPAVPLPAPGFVPRRDALPRVVKRKGELWLGLVGTWVPDGLLPAFADLPETWQLVVVGEAGTSEALRDAALASGAAHRVHAPGKLADIGASAGLFDVLLVAGEGAAQEEAALHAMAAGRPVLAADAPGVSRLLSDGGRDALSGAWQAALGTLAHDPARREAIGAANRARAEAAHDASRAADAARALYRRALGSG